VSGYDELSDTAGASFWQIIGPILTALGIVIGAGIAVVLWLFSRERKELSYVEKSSYRLFDLQDRMIKENLEVLYKGEPVQESHLVVVQLGNTGNRPIEREDFEDAQPLSLDFGPDTAVLAVEVVESETKPPTLYQRIQESLVVKTTCGSMGLGLRPSDIIEGKTGNVRKLVREKNDPDKILIRPVLLNEEDVVTIKTLVAGFRVVRVDARISGVREIRKVERLETYSRRLRRRIGHWVGVILILAVGIGAVFGALIYPSLGSTLLAIFALFLLVPIRWLVGRVVR